jgi:hypothetical protein
VRKLPIVPGATGEWPAPPAVATSQARRSVAVRPEVRAGFLFPDQLVAVYLDDGDLGEASYDEPRIP